jgi:uncharacterized NAD(P)/FAD-binding protein YdhS
LAACGPLGGRLRVAIVGLGPKGLFALERLLHHAHRVGAPAAMDIDLFDPCDRPGAGPVYDPAQPAYLRMNLAADGLTMWPRDSQAVPAARQLSFVAWRAQACASASDERCAPGTRASQNAPDERFAPRAQCGESAPDERFAPRAEVGRYLAAGLEAMLLASPPGVRITLRRSAVRSVRRTGDGWRIVATDDEAACDYDEVLVATGHRTGGDRVLAGSWTHAARLIPAVFPVARWLSSERVPAGATVAVRGFALTFIDAALALTEGRGGSFESSDHPYRLRYVPSAQDAALILPFSRTGRPMLAKPEPGLATGIPALEPIAAAAREAILALPAGFAVRDELRAILAATAAQSLLAARGTPRSGERLRSTTTAAAGWLAGACDGHAPPAGLDPRAEIERSLRVGAGLHPPDLQWALGHSWRSVYPALVDRCGGLGMRDCEWPAFRRLAAQMERVAFGPPAINAAKLLALVDARRVDLAHVAGGRITTAGAITSISGHASGPMTTADAITSISGDRGGRITTAAAPTPGRGDPGGRITTAAAPTTLGGDDGEHVVDAVIDAVLPGPGASASQLLAQLLAGGHARVRDGRRGIDVAPDASCIGRDGTPTPGLSAIGRPTEDAVIGNDTLDRNLHPHADRWASRVTERAVVAAAAAAAIGAASSRAAA